MRRDGRNVFWLVLISMGVITLLSVLYYRHDAVERASALTSERLSDSAKERSITLKAKVDGQFAVLYTFAESLSASEYADKQAMLARMNSLLHTSSFLHIGFVKADGHGYLNNGREVYVGDRDYFRKAISGQRAIEKILSGKLEKQPRFIIAVPLIINRHTVGIIYGSYNDRMLRDLLVPKSFVNKGASYICDSKGEIILDSDSDVYMFGKGMPLYGINNVLTGYSKTVPKGDETVKEMKQNFKEGRRGVYKFSIDGFSRYVVYEPLTINDWFLINGVAGEVVDDAVRNASVLPMVLFCVIVVSMLLIILLVLRWESCNREILEMEEARLRVSEEKFRIATEQSGKQVVRYDIKTKTVYQDYASHCILGADEAIGNVPESSIAAGIIEPESVDEWRNFYAAIARGEHHGSSVIKMKPAASDASLFYKCDFTVINDNLGRPLQAVISFSDITEQRKREIRYELWQQSVSKLPKDKIIVYEYNLTHDVLESVNGELNILPDIAADDTFNLITAKCAEKNIYRDDVENYVKILNRERLFTVFYSGTFEETFDFRLVSDNSDGFRWIHLMIRMVESPDTHDVKAFLIFEDNHEKKLEMLYKEERIHEDSLTGVLNRSSFAERVDLLIKESPLLQHAVFMIDLDNFKHVNDSYGHLAGDKLLIDMSASLKAVLRSGDLIGRIGGDEFVVCLKNIPHDAVIAKKAASLCSLMKIRVAEDFVVSGSIGISVYPRDGSSFSELYKAADVALYSAKNHGRSRYEFYSESEENGGIPQCGTCKADTASDAKKERKLCACGGKKISDEISLYSPDISPVCMNCVYSNEIAKQLDASERIALVTFCTDDNFTVLYANKCYYNIFSDEAEHSFMSCLKPSNRELIKAKITASAAAGAIDRLFEIPIVTRFGEERIAKVLGYSPDGKGGVSVTCCIAGGRDSNDRGDILDRQAAMFAAVVDHASIYYWDYDMRANTSLQCRSLQEEMGIPPIIENYPEAWFEFKLIAPEQYDEYRKLHEDLKSGAPEASMDVKLTNGVWYRVKYTNTFDEDGRPLKAYGTAQNIQSQRSTIALFDKNKEEENSDLVVRAQLAYIFEMSALETFEIDIKAHKLTLSVGTLSKYKLDSVTLEDVPDSMIASGFIHPDSAQSFSDFYNGIYNGKPEGSIIVKAKRINGSFALVRLSYRVLCDENNVPYKAVGISEELENIADARLRFEQEEKLHLLMKHDMVFIFRANLSKDTVTFVETRDSDFFNREYKSYTELYNAAAKYLSSKDDLKDYSGKYSKNALIDAYNSGKDWIYNEYRFCPDGVNIFWVSASVQILTNPTNGDLYCFVYIRNVDDRKKRELTLPFKAEFDATCSFYNRKTVKSIADATIKGLKNQDALCAAVVFKVVNLAEIIERLGPASVDRLMLSINRKVRYTFTNRYATARLADDSIVLFMDDVESEKWVRDSIEYVLQVLNTPSFFTTNADQYAAYKAGVAILSARNADFERLITIASSAAERANLLKPFVQHYKDSYEMEHDNVELIPHAAEDSVSLSAAAAVTDSCSAYLFISCAEILLSGNSPKDAMDGVLAKIGEYYGAERAYILEVDEKNKALDNTYEWCGNGITPQINELKGVPLDAVPSFMKAYQEKKVLVIKDLAGLVETERKILADQNIQSLFVVPYVTNSIVTGFVGVDNPSIGFDQINVLSTLSYFMMSELIKRRSDEHRMYTSRYDILSGVLSRNSFVEYAAETHPESLSSLGVMLADVNGLKDLNSRYGNSYGDDVVSDTAKRLRNFFGKDSVYRYGGGMFLVLLPDISKESFNRNLTEVRNTFARVTKYDISIGSAWSDTVSSLDDLIVKSDEMLTADKRERGGRIKAKKEAEKSKTLAGLMEYIEKGYCVAYLQPKVSTDTMRLCGAEALVRIVHPEQGVIPPGRFIPILEEAGLVRYIDFFMFEEVLRILKRWQDMGRRLMPISLNFSRSTMLEPGIIENMLKISEKYNVPNEMVEIEITESLGDLETETIQRIGNNLLKAGYRLSLDDFGAKYSNLAILSWLKFSVLKLDKSLIDHVVSNEMNEAIISSVISLCEKYHIEVVAEGVEAEIQLKKLKELGCDCIQGYLVNKPIPLEDFENIYLNK